MRRFLLLLSLVLLCSACETRDDPPGPPPPSEEPTFREDGTLTFYDENSTPVKTIRIEIADTDSTRERGMMGRTSAPEDTGMLFIFEESGPKSFWMLNTPLSLDMLFVSPDSTIVQINKYVRPLTTQSTSTSESARFVVELPAGKTDAYGLREGMKIGWTRTR